MAGMPAMQEQLQAMAMDGGSTTLTPTLSRQRERERMQEQLQAMARDGGSTTHTPTLSFMPSGYASLSRQRERETMQEQLQAMAMDGMAPMTMPTLSIQRDEPVACNAGAIAGDCH
jgi:hypothetical protein